MSARRRTVRQRTTGGYSVKREGGRGMLVEKELTLTRRAESTAMHYTRLWLNKQWEMVEILVKNGIDVNSARSESTATYYR